MNSNVRRRLGATSLRPWTPNFPSRGSFCDGTLRHFKSNQNSDHRRLFQGVASQYSHSPLKIHQPLQRATAGVTAWEGGGGSARWILWSNKSFGFEHKIWDRRKHSSYLNLESRRHFCGNIKLLESHSRDEVKNIGRINVTAKTGNNVLEPSRQRPQEVPISSNAGYDTRQKHLIDRLPNIPHIHRPSKEELLAAATGFWSRLKVRFKWFSIRSARPFNVDEIGAFFSWVLLGHMIWIVLGTTTFFSLAIFAVNTVFAQGAFTSCSAADMLTEICSETLARWVGNYLTKSSGVKVVFESAIVPSWGDGVITFKNVFVSRRPGQGTAQVSKGSPATAAAAAALGRAKDSGEEPQAGYENDDIEEDTNYTQFDVSLDTVNVTLSFSKWFNSKGLLRDVEIKGVRGVVDRTSVHSTGAYVDPRTYKHEHNPGDFEINSFKLEDVLVTVHQPHNFRPFSVSVYSCDLPRLRRQWLFYDFLSANNMSGSFDESLFTIHPRQMHNHAGAHFQDIGEANVWKKQSRLRIDGLNIDHLNRGVEGPFSWIHQGNVDIVADILFPADSDESIAKVMSDFYDRLEATVTSSQRQQQRDSNSVIDNEGENEIQSAGLELASASKDDKRFLVMDLRVHLNDVRAAVPIFTRDLSYVNNALIRPIVAYINSRKAFIPIHCRVVKRASEFDGSWTIFDSGLMDDLSAEVS